VRPADPRGIFVTGTDTGVGKTLVACALLHACAKTGLRVIGMKPVASGAEHTAQGLVNDDLRQLCAASNVAAPARLTNPFCFEPPIAPHLAAQLTGVNIDLGVIVEAFHQLTTFADLVVVEGVGGFCVPLNGGEDTSDLARCLELPVVLIVGMRLGCLNHALLTVEAIRAAGLRLAGWVANRVDPTMACSELNIAALRERIDAPLLADIAFCEQPSAAAVAPMIDLSALR
jgi:dethiobiotin synthetase